MMRSILSIGTFVLLSLGVLALGVNFTIALWQKLGLS